MYIIQFLSQTDALTLLCGATLNTIHLKSVVFGLDEN